MTFREVFLPYCVQRVADGRWVVLNRYYKPLGLTTTAWVDYNDYALPLNITAKMAQKISDTDLGAGLPRCRVWLYSDASAPNISAVNSVAYFRRLAALAKVRIQG